MESKIRNIIREEINKIISESSIAYRGSNYLKSDDKKSYIPSGYYAGTYYFLGDDAEEKALKFGKHLSKIDIDGLKLYNINNDKDAELLKAKTSKEGYHTTSASGDSESKYLKSIGYDGIKRGNEVIIF